MTVDPPVDQATDDSLNLETSGPVKTANTQDDDVEITKVGLLNREDQLYWPSILPRKNMLNHAKYDLMLPTMLKWALVNYTLAFSAKYTVAMILKWTW